MPLHGGRTLTEPGRDPMSAKHNVVVVGDIIVDHHIYEGERDKPTASSRRGFREVRESGGAATLHRLLNAVLPLSGKHKPANGASDGGRARISPAPRRRLLLMVALRPLWWSCRYAPPPSGSSADRWSPQPGRCQSERRRGAAKRSRPR